MNKMLQKAIRATLDSWNNLSEDQKGKDFEDSRLRLEQWLIELLSIETNKENKENKKDEE